MTPRLHTGMGLAASLVVAATVAWGFVLVGSPTSRRQERFDDRRLDDLQTIVRAVQAIVLDTNKKGTLREALPSSLEQIVQRAKDRRVDSKDPETGQPYGYKVTGKSTFEVCAKFSLPRDSDWRVFWNHPAGEHCFKVDVLDPPP